GAQAAGLSTLDKWARKKDLHYRQALCAVGQVELMKAWGRAFDIHGLHVAQILLTREDFADSLRTLNMRNTIFTLIDEGIIPIINENDTVSVEEIKIGDNDTLAARSALLWNANLLVLFSDIDGIYSENPHINPNAAFIPEVRDPPALRQTISAEGTSKLGTGGITTKINAAELCFEYGIPTIITRGKPAALAALAAGTQRGTVFLPG
ncbi:MAG: glutamate 5-kinase, partial [Spirochaetaceae bacterium]|nr:glutamate 5-kinase [Spirochaetaceae bacterium]